MIAPPNVLAAARGDLQQPTARLVCSAVENRFFSQWSIWHVTYAAFPPGSTYVAARANEARNGNVTARPYTSPCGRIRKRSKEGEHDDEQTGRQIDRR